MRNVRRPVCSAAIRVLPDPPKRSSTFSPGRLLYWIARTADERLHPRRLAGEGRIGQESGHHQGGAAQTPAQGEVDKGEELTHARPADVTQPSRSGVAANHARANQVVDMPGQGHEPCDSQDAGRTEKRTNPRTGKKYPWLVRTTSMVNHFYFYCIDEDFGPFFLKFCSYFPYTAKLCINGHEYAKRQLVKEGIAHESLDNGILSCADPQRLQQICDGLSAKKINALLRKWLARLPHPFTAADRAAGYRYEISVLQAEFSLTQVLDRPLVGRIFFEEVIRENLDLGRPDHVQLVFQRPIHKRTPGCFRTRVVTEGVVPSLYIDYKGCRIKQYHKEGRALRTETVVNNTVDFQIGKRLQNLPALREVGFRANRRLLDVQHISHDCAIGEEVFRQVTGPITVHGQRASALRYADPCVLALFSALLVFRLLPRGFAAIDRYVTRAKLTQQS
jgi:hypothetical protein